MNPDVLCMGCMRDTLGAEVCPHCGYRKHTPAESSVQLSPYTVLRDKYLLGRVLGQGGFGITYLAYDLQQNWKLAIKEYFPAVISTRAQDRLTVTPLSNRNKADLEYGLGKFAEEARALARFSTHPNVVTMLDFFHDNGTAYIVMAYIEGHTFKDHLSQRGGKIPFDDALAILSLVMNALQDLHAVGILHRDISPDNIYVEQSGGVRILDFGATRYAMGEQSRSLSVVLKPGYAPEEQYRSRGKQGPWTDIYALGATFYRAIVGRIPPESADRVSLDDLTPPSQLAVDLPQKSEAALMKALAVKAENRFQNIADFRQAITPPPRIAVTPARLSRSVFLPFTFIPLFVIFIFGWTDPSTWPITFFSYLTLAGVMLALIFCMWRPIQDGHARTTPGKAVGFSFIPFFNFYWAFQVMWGFAKDYNSFVDRHSLEVEKLNEKLFLFCTVSFLAYSLTAPFDGVLARLVLLVFACLLLAVVVRICDAVNVLGASQPRMPIRADMALEGPKDRRAEAARRLALHCTTGDYQGHDIELETQEIVIGRSPAVSNLVLLSAEVSAKHVRVWRDKVNWGAWIEDLHSTNGTFYKESASGAADWIRLSGAKFLSVGDRFRLSQDAAEFEVKGA